MKSSPAIMKRAGYLLLAIAFLATGARFLHAASGAAQQTEARKEGRKKEKGKEKEWQAMVIDAGVVKFGADLQAASPPEFREWAGAYVTKQMATRPVDPRATIGAVDARYAAASDLARDAGIYLLYYLAYKDDDENQRLLSYRVRDIDRETYDIGRQLQILWESQQNSLVRGSLAPQARIQQEEQEQKFNAKLRELGDERQLKATQIAASQKKVNLYLRLMSAAFAKMKGTDPAVLRELK